MNRNPGIVLYVIPFACLFFIVVMEIGFHEDKQESMRPGYWEVHVNGRRYSPKEWYQSESGFRTRCRLGLYSGFILSAFLAVTVSKAWRKEKRQFDALFNRMRNISQKVMQNKCTREDIEDFERSYIAISKFPADPGARNEISQLKDRIMFCTAAGKMYSATVELERLAELRQSGMISDDEFKAFSERFTVSTGDKAQKIVKAIHALHKEYKDGALSLGNYHAAVWSLLDKIDRKT